MKKLLTILLLGALLITGCGGKNENVSGSLKEIANKLYDGIAEDKLPMMFDSWEVTKENIKQYVGTDEIEFKEALVSESHVGSIPHSVVLIRLESNATTKEIEDTKKKIEENANPRKWICVAADNVYVLNKGNLIVLIMSNDLAEPIKNNFENL